MEEASNNVTATSTEVNEPTKDASKPVSYSQEEYDKAIRSASSKAKNDILHELGISSVKDFSILKETYEKSINENEALKKSNDDLNHRLVLKGLKVKDDASTDFITLATARMSDKKDFSAASKEVAELYPNMLESYIEPTSAKLGNPKSENPSTEPKYSKDILKRYPYLQHHIKK